MIKELEDYNWFPKTLRRWQLEFVGSVSVWTKLYQPLSPVLDEMIVQNNITALQDLCSGSGIPAIYMHQHLKEKIPMLLTDQYPDTDFKNKPAVEYSLQPVDVLKMQPVENTVYTMCNAFHHFSAVQQKELLQKMAANKAPVVVAEILEPGLLNIIKIIFTTIIIQLFTAPFVQPFSLLRLLFTYIIPVNLFTVTYDGIISVLKSKTAAEYKEIVKNISTQSYHITVHTVNNWKGNLVYIKGAPINT
ncbi:hypothetical protein [Ferruginibacter sp. SUN106]|uniref:hypothetical protein n=1 Tax=Ferruginibacter sp. SUN106 TaxID=2978348 RepID=UPI003D367D44